MKDIVAGLIIENKRLLLVHNIKYGLRIEPPGGKKEDYDKTYEAATEREIREELGIDVKVKKRFGIYPTNSPEGSTDVHMFLCERLDGQEPISQEPKKIGECKWYSYSELESIREMNQLGPNLCSALPQLRSLMS